jgi:hypothetical protein
MQALHYFFEWVAVLKCGPAGIFSLTLFAAMLFGFLLISRCFETGPQGKGAHQSSV